MGKKKRLPPHSSFFKSHIHFSILYLYECTSINQSQVVSLFFSLYLIQLLPLPPRPRREGYFLCPFKKKKQHIFCLSLFLFLCSTLTHTKIKTNKLFSSLTYCLFNQQKKQR